MQTIAGRFRIERLEREGGMGAVYRAHDETTGRPVALKVLRATSESESVDMTENVQGTRFADELVARFLREATTLEELVHPHIVTLVAHGVDDGSPYIAMEWLEGETLGARIVRSKLTPREALKLGIDIADALGLAHSHGIVHRDIKPSNLYLVSITEQVKVLDFGIARIASGFALTTTGALLGTPSYVAPEQARGVKDVDARADVYSLGCVLYAAVAGAPPFPGTMAADVLARVLREDPVPLKRVAPDAPDPFVQVVSLLMQRDRDARPANAWLARTALERTLEQLEVR